MRLSERLEMEGQWLFRRRSYLPLPVLALAIGSLFLYRRPLDTGELDHAWEIVCVSIGLIGLGIRALAVGYAPANTSGRNTGSQAAASLNTTGIYSVVRHPLYLGNFFMWMGPALYPRTWWLPILASFLFWLYYERIMLAEEGFLAARFGDAFLEWAATTPAFVLRPSLWRWPATSYSLRKVFRREMSGFLGLVLTFWLLEMVGDLAYSGRPEFDPGWSAFLGFGVVSYSTLKFLKHRTRLLRDPARSKECS